MNKIETEHREELITEFIPNACKKLGSPMVNLEGLKTWELDLIWDECCKAMRAARKCAAAKLIPLEK